MEELDVIKVNGKLCPVYSDEYTILPINRDKAAMVNVNNIMSLNIGEWRTYDVEKSIDEFLIRMSAYEPPISTIYIFFGALYESKNNGTEEYYGRFTTPQSLIVQKEGGAYHSGAIANSLLGMIHDKMDKALIEAKQLIALDQMDLGDWFEIVGDICIVFESTCLKYWEDINPKPPVLVKTPEAPSGVVYAPYALEEHCPTIGNFKIDPKYMLDESTERYSRCFQVN